MYDKNKNAIHIYDSIAEDYAQAYDPLVSSDDLHFPNIFLEYLKPNSSIVDLGCGTGFSSNYFTSKGHKTLGIDLSDNMLTICNRKYPQLQFSKADIRTFNPTTPVDAVWAGYSLFHFDERDFIKTLTNVYSYLKPDGVFGIVMQEGEGEITLPEPFLPSENIYIKLYTQKELLDLLTQVGFILILLTSKPTMYQGEFDFNKLLVILKK